MYGEWILQWLWIPALAAVAAQDVRAAVSLKPVAIQAMVPSTQIRVRLAEAAPMASVHGFDLHVSTSGQGNGTRHLAPTLAGSTPVAASPDGNSTWEIRCRNERVRVIRSDRGGQSLDLPSPVSFESRSGFIHFRNRAYRDEIRIYAVGSLCEVVNHLDIERYLSGLVNAEFSSRWNEEAIEAQVIAARTYALHRIRQSRNTYYDVDATVRDQVYDGLYREDSKASRIVQKTRGMVLTLGDGRTPLKAFYHSTCAGRTELPENVWGKPYPGYTRSVPCPYCAHSPAINWQLDLGNRELVEAIARGARLEEKLPGWLADWPALLREGQLTDVRVKRLDGEGRVAEVLTSWRFSGKSRVLAIGGPKLREWLGPSRFRSAAFQVSAERSGQGSSMRWHFEGRGNGHGVGMCQYGAKAMGEKGFRMAAILHHYYPSALLRKLW